MEETPEMRRRLHWLVGIITFLFYCGITFTIMLDEKPDARKVAEAVYGTRPFGLPWQVVHVVVFALLFAPLPVLLISAIRIFVGSRMMDRPVSGVLSFLVHYRVLIAVPQLRPHVCRVTIVSLGYLFLLFVWIVFTAVKGI